MTRSSLQLLMSLLLGCIAMVIAQNAACPLEEKHEAPLVIQYATTTTTVETVSSETIATLEQGILDTYNGMQAGSCDTQTKIAVAVEFVDTQSVRRLATSSFDDSESRQLMMYYAFYFTIYFVCRGCGTSPSLFGNDAPTRRLAQVMKKPRVDKKLFQQKLNRWIDKKRSEGRLKLKGGSVQDVVEDDSWGI